MRKVIVSMNITEDGFMSDADHSLDWHFRFWDEEMAEALALQLGHADTILLGRKTYEAMAAYWPSQINNPNFPREDFAFAEMMNRYKKIVFSNTLKTLYWKNSFCNRSPLYQEVSHLKNSPGRNIIIYGSASIVDALIPTGLIDEYQLWIHPILLHHGHPFHFSPENFKSVFKKSFNSGVVLAFYQPVAVFK